jgi:hypothetical protein
MCSSTKLTAKLERAYAPAVEVAVTKKLIEPSNMFDVRGLAIVFRPRRLPIIGSIWLSRCPDGIIASAQHVNLTLNTVNEGFIKHELHVSKSIRTRWVDRFNMPKELDVCNFTWYSHSHILKIKVLQNAVYFYL